MTGTTNAHTTWCARGHRCALGEHRSDPIVADVPGLARAVLVRVRAADGKEHAEIRVRLALDRSDLTARDQLRLLLAGLRTLLVRTVTAKPPRLNPPGRRSTP